MASSDTAAQVLASEDKQMVLKEGLAACSEYTRADMITLTSVTQASSRRRRLSTNNLVVAFDIIVVAEAYGFDESTVQQLFDSSRPISRSTLTRVVSMMPLSRLPRTWESR